MVNFLIVSVSPFVLVETPVGTIKDWEQERFKPPGDIQQYLLRIAIEHPDVIYELSA